MLPLAYASPPASHIALVAALTDGLARAGLATRAIEAEGGGWPVIEQLRIDLTGARLTRELRLPHARPVGGEALAVTNLEVVAAPIYFEGAPLQLSLRASGAALEFARSDAGDALLTLARVAAGTVTIEVSRIDLEAFAHSAIVAAAAEQGAEIKSTRLEVESRGPRSVSFRAEVAAKMFIMNAKVAVSGLLDINDALEARLSRLECAGEGMIAKTASAFLRPQFAKLEQRAFPLLALPLGEVKLRDVTLEAGASLRLEAQFAS